MMILFPTVLNDERRSSEMSVVAWTVSMILGTCRHLHQGPQSVGRLFIQQPALRAIFSFNFCYYLKEKFVAHPFVNSQMAGVENEATQYESPNEGSRNAGSSDSYESPSPPHPPCTKRQRASVTEDPDYIP
jgi:hypothetical protein